MDRRLVTVSLDNKDAGLMVDVNEDGMAVQALARIKPGKATSLQFELPDTTASIEAGGTVVWADETSGRAGIRFHSLPEASAACLKEWIGRSTAVDQPTPAPVAPSPVPTVLGPQSKLAQIAALQREISSQGLEGDAALALIVERARSLTRADGAAIVLGDSKWMVCRASSGSAPPVGADLLPDSGLSGECVRTGVTVRCEDTELDPRVDLEACRSISLRSAVIVPLFTRGNVSGLVEVLYTSPRAFDALDVLLLRRMADLVSATLGNSVSRELKPPVVSAPAERAVHPAPMIPPVPRTAPQPGKVVCNVDGQENPQASSARQKYGGSLPGRMSAEATGWAEETAVNRTSPDAQSDERKPWLTLRVNASPRLLALTAVLLLLLGIWGWQEYKSRQASAEAPTNAAIEPGR